MNVHCFTKDIFKISTRNFLKGKMHIFQAREHCQAMRNAFLLLLMFQLTICLIQLLDAVLLLPPIFNTHHVLWLVLVILPLMTVSMMGSPRDNSIMKKALGKNKKHLTKQVCNAIKIVFSCYLILQHFSNFFVLEKMYLLLIAGYD